MSAIDDYLATVEPAKRAALERIRTMATAAVPEAGETISYGMPALTYRGKPFLGFAARANFIGIYPFSGHVIGQLAAELRGYRTSRGAIRVPLDAPIPEPTLRAVIGCRLRAIRDDAAGG